MTVASKKMFKCDAEQVKLLQKNKQNVAWREQRGWEAEPLRYLRLAI